jgi:uncharacterized membrane protein YphA (DoxX/SURF4 family)
MRFNRQVALDVLLWVFALFLAWIFLRQGSSKFSDDSGWARAFRAWHYPDWFRVMIGVIEVIAGLLLLTRRTAPLGALMIVAVMLGAMGTHIRAGRPQQMTSEILPITLATIVAVGRRRHFVGARRRPQPAGLP